MFAHQEIKRILDECNLQHGWLIPTPVVEFTTSILVDKLDKNPWQPNPSYAEQYMQIRTREQALALGNTCWFTRAVFPELMKKRGINEDYYVLIGKSCYERVLQAGEVPTVRTLYTHFEFIAETAYTAIRHNGEFREMWD
jgi:hypothetical protein